MNLLVKRLRPNAKVPVRQHDGDSGLDLYAAEQCTIVSGKRRLVATGVAVHPKSWTPFGSIDAREHECQVRPRSGLTAKGIDVGWGTVDRTYTGEVMICVINNSGTDYVVREGDRIAQLVVAQVPEVSVVEVTELKETARGERGHGSTGR
jgi:dUTP pyrophosphatase